VFETLTTLEVIADQESLEAAQAVVSRTIAYWDHVSMLAIGDEFGDDQEMKAYAKTVRDWLAARDKYREAIRREVGTKTPLVEPSVSFEV
jgi:hypothetical protein